jgi:hypothetical protein
MRRIFPKGTAREVIIKAVMASLEEGQSYQVTVEPFRKPRSHQQNAYLWGVVYPTIIEAGGEALRGWTADDLHEYFLGEIHGWEVIEGFGRKRMKPVKRSSRMTKTEFMDYLEQISQRCAQMGIVIPEPTYETP